MKIAYPVFLIIIVLILLAFIIISPAAALKVEGAKIMLDVKPGTTYIFPMAISTKPDDPPSDYAAEVYGFGQSMGGGSYIPLADADDIGAYSARTFVSLSSTTFHIDPGQRKEFNATIRVPQNIGEGGRYAIIHIHPAVKGSGQTAIATAIIVPVMLTIQNTNLVESGIITDIDVGQIAEGKPITVSTSLKNTGNHHYYGIGNQVTIIDTAGNLVATTTADPIPNAVIPGQLVRFDATFSTLLDIGTYTIKSDMMLESGEILDSRSISVTVKETYIPPFKESSVMVSPDSPAIVSVPEKTITISILRGAVLADTLISLKPYTETLPQIPSGAVAGSTAFSVDGLSGLLAQDATVTVRYNQADLNAAGGNAENLVLGRFDRVEGRWALLPTTVEQNAMTLTATTNRFSIWTVIAVQESSQTKAQGSTQITSSGPGPLLVCGLIVLILFFRRIQN